MHLPNWNSLMTVNKELIRLLARSIAKYLFILVEACRQSFLLYLQDNPTHTYPSNPQDCNGTYFGTVLLSVPYNQLDTAGDCAADDNTLVLLDCKHPSSLCMFIVYKQTQFLRLQKEKYTEAAANHQLRGETSQQDLITSCCS